MWTALFITILILVHIQFKYCAQIGVAALKLAETAILVLIIRAYMESDIVWEYLGTLNETLNETLNWNAIWNAIWNANWNANWNAIWDKLQALYKYQHSAEQ